MKSAIKHFKLILGNAIRTPPHTHTHSKKDSMYLLDEALRKGFNFLFKIPINTHIPLGVFSPSIL